MLTSLYPSPPRPLEGIFVERRWCGMRERGHEVLVTHPLPRTPGPLARGAWAEIRAMPSREERAGIRVERPRYLHLPGRARRNARRFARIGTRRILGLPEKMRPDVVVCDYAWPSAEAAPMLARAGIPAVISGRGSDVLQVAGEAGLAGELARCLQAASGWCAVSADLVQEMDRVAGQEGRGVLVPNGVDLRAFPLREREDARAQLAARGAPSPAGGWQGQGRVVVVVGHLIERKDPLLALEVVGRLPGVTCYFLGRGPLGDALARRALELGLGERFHLRGEASPEELALWYSASDALLLTSQREGRPNVVLEVLAAGRPVLATESGGTEELLTSWLERSLARTRDPDALSRMLLALLEDPPSPPALRASVEPLSWSASLAELERCLEAAVRRGVLSR